MYTSSDHQLYSPSSPSCNPAREQRVREGEELTIQVRVDVWVEEALDEESIESAFLLTCFPIHQHDITSHVPKASSSSCSKSISSGSKSLSGILTLRTDILYLSLSLCGSFLRLSSRPDNSRWVFLFALLVRVSILRVRVCSVLCCSQEEWDK
jgi:hypothetical protein